MKLGGGWARNPLVITIVITVIVLTLLWFKGGEFFCRMRGGEWFPIPEICRTFSD